MRVFYSLQHFALKRLPVRRYVTSVKSFIFIMLPVNESKAVTTIGISGTPFSDFIGTKSLRKSSHHDFYQGFLWGCLLLWPGHSHFTAHRLYETIS